MNPGRELDALVDEKVMHEGPCAREDYGIGNGFRRCECGAVGRWNEDFVHYRPYSTNISAAWQIVEKLKAQDPALFFQLANSINRKWECQCGDGWSESDTAPRAICLAALKAVGL